MVEDIDVIHPYDDGRYRPVGLGVFKHYEADQNMARAAKEFNLTRIARKRRDDGVGIWDGTEIIFTVRFLTFYPTFLLNTRSWEAACSLSGIG